MAPGKCKAYKELCLKEKIELLKFLETNSQRAAAKKFQISKGCVSNISKRKAEYMQRFEENENEYCTRKIRKTDNFEVNQATFEWFKRMRGMNARISGPMLQEVARNFAKELKVEDFHASNGWLESFKKRHYISQKVLCGESNDVDAEIVDSFKDRITSFIEDYKMENVFNADECGLFYRAMPNRTLAMSGDNCKDGKISKERLTILLSCSATGEKLMPLVIGKAKQPRCFKNMDLNNLPVLWYANRKAWMTTAIFTEWVGIINKQMKRDNRNILLIIDNCTAHPTNLSLSNVKVKFLPANTTSYLQPLDQGIIRSFKLYYRKSLLQAVIARCGECNSANEIAACINVLDAIMWIKESWQEVRRSTISKCFGKAGFLQNEDKSNQNDKTDVTYDTDICGMQELIEHLPCDDVVVNAEKFLNFDNDVPFCSSVHPQNLINDIVSEINFENESVSSGEIENCEDTIVDLPSDAYMLEMCKKMKVYALKKCPAMLNPLRDIEKLTENVIINNKTLRQTTIKDFF